MKDIKQSKSKMRKILKTLIVCFSIISFSQAQTLLNFSAPGTGTWTCPAGVTSVTVECFGGGGGGGGDNNVSTTTSGGGGGGGCSHQVLTVIPGNAYSYTVGVGGAGGHAAGGVGVSGTASTFFTVTANPGNGGGAGAASNGNGGAGGFGNLSNGTNGSAGVNNLSGMGGNSGIGSTSGFGGSSINTNANGMNGGVPGGGGSGANHLSGGGKVGGSGGNGLIKLTYTVDPAETLNFDGNGYVNCGNSALINVLGSITLEAWIKRNSIGEDDCIINKNNFANNDGYSLWVFSNNLFALRFGNLAYFSNSSVPAGSWNHLSASYDGNEIRLYLNGNLDKVYSGVSNPMSNTGDLFIGTPQDAVGNSFYNMNGDVDEVRIWNRALCQAELQNNLNCEITSGALGLLANYHFNQGITAGNNTAITTLIDDSGNSLNGSLIGFNLTGNNSNWVSPGGIIAGNSCGGFSTPIPLVSTSSITNVSCNGQTDGSAILTVSGGAVFSYDWLPGSPIGEGSSSVSGLSAGIYTCVVTNECGGVTNHTIGITEPPPISLSLISSPTSICSSQTSTLSVFGANQYTWSPGNFNGNQIVVSPTITTIYTVTATNSLSCLSSKTIALQVNPIPNISIISSSNNAQCTNPIVGTTFLPDGSGTSYQTCIPVSCYESSQILNSINDIQDICINIEHSYLGDLQIEIICPNNQSSILKSYASGGGGIYLGNPLDDLTNGPGTGRQYCFSMSAPTLLINGSTNSAGNPPSPSIVAGTYSPQTSYTNLIGCPLNGNWCLKVTDNLASDDGYIFGWDINFNPILYTQNTSSVAVCQGQELTLSASGASSYTWTNGIINGTAFTPSVSQTYSISGTDINGCVGNKIFSVQTNSLPVISSVLSDNSVCLGEQITFTNNGAITYTILPSNNTGAFITEVPDILGSSTYTVIGVDNIGCVGEITKSFEVFDLPTIIITPSVASVCQGEGIQITLNGAVSYTDAIGATTQTLFTMYFGGSETYTISGEDINGCVNTASASITVLNTPSVSISSPTSSICYAYTQTITAVGADSYIWFNGATTNTAVIQPLTNTTYSVIGINGGVCKDTAYLPITVLSLPTVFASANNTSVCVGESVSLSATGNAVSYLWTPGNLFGPNQTTSVNSPTTFTLLAQGANGCANFDLVFVDVKNTLTITPIANPIKICVGDSSALSVIGGAVSTWSVNANPNQQYVAPTANTTYTFMAIDANNCSSKVEFNILINEDCDIEVYNGFTPNGDGINDFWVIDNINKIQDNKVVVFNRWGKKVFETFNYNNVDNYWDGQFDGKKVPSGTYYFMIVDNNNKVLVKAWLEITY